MEALREGNILDLDIVVRSIRFQLAHLIKLTRHIKHGHTETSH